MTYLRPVFVLSNILFPSKRVSPPSARQLATKEDRNRNLIGLGYFFLGLPYVIVSAIYIHLITDKHRICVCDRYFYQFLYDIYGDNSRKILKIIPKGDATILLTTEVDKCYARMESSDAEVKSDYYNRVQNYYLDLSEEIGFYMIDAAQDAETINQKIINYLKEKIDRLVILSKE